MAAEVYYPPSGVWFRLYNPKLARYVYARKGFEDVGSISSNEPAYADQWFTFVYHPYHRVSYLKNKIGQLLGIGSLNNESICVSSPDPGEKAIDGGSDVELRPARSKNGESCLRVIFKTHPGYSLQTNSNGKIWPVEPSHFDVNEDDQLWQMVYEDMEFEEIKWDVANGKILGNTPDILRTFHFKNDSPGTMTHVFEVEEKVTHTSQFCTKFGFSFKEVVSSKGILTNP
ncbi:uncharacterized protein PGRI_082830 [Penicillium griseofulvum]|uniref:Ricin B lectin n=1 Tax=Penicillium patulum TaxID=5078 RepID=A0A135LSU0_PENPA|nr:uncharacterized protein PGRI_082830 [Penicillium griseofulvum]KXG51999.1 hypothetical protein PGRI_082830 [Penicillium griseofulvum]